MEPNCKLERAPISPSLSLSIAHYNFLDGIRALLALYVVVYHSWLTQREFNPVGLSPFFNLVKFGHFAVCFFIIVSGFCLTLPTLKNQGKAAYSYSDFIKRRTWRIAPPYYFAMLFSLICIHFWIGKPTGSHWDLSLPTTGRDVLEHILLVQNFFGESIYKINHAFWSISVEWQIYFFFPCLLVGWRSMGPLVTTGCAFVASVMIEFGLRHYLDIAAHLYLLGFFAVGMLAARLSFAPDPKLDGYRAWPWRFICLVSLVIFLVLENFFSGGLLSNLPFCLFSFSILIVSSLQREGWLHRFLSLRPLVFLGSFSYSTYLIHAPLVQILWQYPLSSLQTRPNIMCLALFILGTPLILLASYVFYLLFEKRFVPGKNQGSLSTNARHSP